MLADYKELIQLRDDYESLSDSSHQQDSSYRLLLDQMSVPSLRVQVLAIADALIGGRSLPTLGGGGSSTSDLRWIGCNPYEEEDAYRRRCLSQASKMVGGNGAKRKRKHLHFVTLLRQIPIYITKKYKYCRLSIRSCDNLQLFLYLYGQNLANPIKKSRSSDRNMKKIFVDYLIEGNNYPPVGYVSFDSSDHIRFQNGKDVSGHNLGCNRRFVFEKNIEGGEGYTVTMYNLDGLHPLWKDNIQMAPKRMRIVSANENIVELRGYGYDENALALGVPLSDASFASYGVALLIEDAEIKRIQLNMYDRDISIVYLK